MAGYAKDVLVETQWVEDHLNDDSIRIVEVDENPALYAEAHIPGAIGFDWKKDLQDQVKCDFLGPAEFGVGSIVAFPGLPRSGGIADEEASRRPPAKRSSRCGSVPH